MTGAPSNTLNTINHGRHNAALCSRRRCILRNLLHSHPRNQQVMSTILITLFAAAAAVTVYSIGVCIALAITK